MNQTNTNKVAKNTFVLYIRMIVTLFIGLWTTRLVLNALGFIDNGIYNVVGGFVAFFAIITNSQANSISRFITYEIGRGDLQNIKKIYHNALVIEICLSLAVLVLAETIGLWFVNYKLVIPPSRIVAANIVYQFSVAAFIVGILSTSQNAIIIANEKMNIFAIVSVGTSLAKLAICLLLLTIPSPTRLVAYSVLLFLLSLASRLLYYWYNHKNFPEYTYRLRTTKDVFRPMFSYAGWSFIGESSGVLRSSGISVLLNLFGGPIANTVNGIANQVNSLCNMFVNDFTTAFNPQITKRFAAQEYGSLITYLFKCSKFSFFLTTIIAIPLLFNTQFVLDLWLKEVPSETNYFTKLIILISMIESISKPLITAKAATGNIRNYQIVVGGILLLSLPIAYIFLKLGFPLYYSYIALLVTSVLAFASRMIMLNGAIPLWSCSKFIQDVIVRDVFVVILASLCALILGRLISNGFICVAMDLIISCFIVLYIGCGKDERLFIFNMISSMLCKRKR